MDTLLIVKSDPVKKEVWVEDYTKNPMYVALRIHSFTTYSPDSFCEELRIIGSPKDKYKKFTEKYKITPKKITNVVNAHALDVWVSPIKDLVWKYAYSNYYKADTWKVRKIWDMLDDIRQAERDGNHNIIPFIMKYRKSPKDLKKHFGKSVWKRLTKNSRTRNKYIVDRDDFTRGNGYKKWYDSISKIPSTILKEGFPLDDDIIKLIVSDKRTIPFKQLCNYEDNVTIRDTIRMSQKLKKKVDLSMSLEEFKIEHDLLVQKINQLKYKDIDDEFNIPTNIVPYIETSIDGVYCKATLLKTRRDYLNEGGKMHHCVASYADSAKGGRYFTYHLVCGEEESTLGLSARSSVDLKGCRTTTNVSLDQVYGYCNTMVGEVTRIFTNDIISKLNDRGL